MTVARFHNRTHAGRRLARELRPYTSRHDLLVLALPRGGVPVAYEVACVMTPEPFHAVGLWYEDFTQTIDDEVRDLLARARVASPPTPHAG